MVNASLTYEILLYLNSFYFGMFGPCEVGMGVLKGVNLTYTKDSLLRDALLLVSLLIAESIRIYCGRHGSLSDHGWRVICSVFLTFPSAGAVTYLLYFQTYTLGLEYILCALLLALQITELFYALLFVLTMCRPPNYN
ncbi:uncharacterized protein LOC129799643 [Phlebotomus papatasi]|uniref:uncharacterized protein LOC129799643 n=1 Tax=Phlebotomus papatasi TaxID=29031 RepID=UPI00248396B4|nr:uncharacterized protein LOC129799643 [Phlebotomus papatasi]